MKRPIALWTLLPLLAGCAVGPDYQRPETKADPDWHAEATSVTTTQAVQADPWWRQLHDPLLDELIGAAADNNRDLAAALANIDQARALRRVAGAGFMPSVNASASVRRSRFSRQTGFGANSGMRNNFDAGLDASWELDLFGRTRRAVEAADAQLEATVAIHDGLRLSIIAETAAAYFELRGLQRRITNTEQDIGLLKQIEEIAQAQFDAGIVSGLDVSRAQGERQTLEAQLPDLQAQMTARIYRIAVLTGRPPEFYAARLRASRPVSLPGDPVPVGLRSEILMRRPDVRQAERELAAATAGIGIARADLFPSFSLTGAIGTSARVFSDMFTPATMTGSLGAALGWPVFAGGAITAKVDAAEAEAKAALAAYEQAVLLALEDAEGALMRYGKAWQRLKRLHAALASRRESFDIARLRYEAGEEDFLAILDAQRALIATRNDVVDAETAILSDLTLLHKALGGSWMPPPNKYGE